MPEGGFEPLPLPPAEGAASGRGDDHQHDQRWPATPRSGHASTVPLDPGETGRGSGFAALDKRIPLRFTETRTRQCEETPDQTGNSAHRVAVGSDIVGHGWY